MYAATVASYMGLRRLCRLVLLLTGPTYALRVDCNDHLYGRIKHSLKKDHLDLFSENHSSTRTIQNGITGSSA
jgi:hypothetical protein